MKRFKQFVAFCSAVALCVLLPGFHSMTVSAEEPTTYYVKYISELDQYRQMPSATWDTSKEARELYYMEQSIKDGDIGIVEGSKPNTTIKIPAHLSNLTLIHDTSTIVTTNGVDECYILHGCYAAINGDVKNAYVYNDATCTFNNNVQNLYVKDDSGLHANITCGGTVAHVIGQDTYSTFYDYYNFAAGKLNINDGKVKTDASFYSTTAPAQSTDNAQAATNNSQADTTQASANNQTNTTQNDADEYDDVPKTGESQLAFYLLGISALCLVGRHFLKKA